MRLSLSSPSSLSTSTCPSPSSSFFFPLLHFELHTELDNLVTMQNLRTSANKGSNDALRRPHLPHEVMSPTTWSSSQPVFCPHPPILEGMLRRSFVSPGRREGPPSIWDTWYIGKRFCRSTCIFISSLASRIESMEFVNRGAASCVCSGETRTKSRSEMPVWTVSQKFSHLQWRRLFKELWGRPTTTADFGSPATFACWKIRFKTEVCTCSRISYGSYAMDQRSVRWLIQWMI